MRAIALDSFDAPAAPRDLPEPSAGQGELLIRVSASSANPVDNAIAGGMLQGMFEHEFPITLGRDFAGVVEATGDGVSRFAEGDEVFGFLPHAAPVVHAGAWNELIVAAEDGFVAAKPGSVGMAEAAAAALAAITAMAATDAIELGDGDTALIVGATGGVGTFATQLAKLAGARVIASGLPEDEDYLSGLGVDLVVPREGDVAAAVREAEPNGVSALIDTVSMSTEDLEVFAAALAEGGRVASPVGAAGEGENRHDVMGSSDPARTGRVAELLGQGALRVPIQRTYSFEDAADSLTDLTARHTQGKLAIQIAS